MKKTRFKPRLFNLRAFIKAFGADIESDKAARKTFQLKIVEFFLKRKRVTGEYEEMSGF